MQQNILIVDGSKDTTDIFTHVLKMHNFTTRAVAGISDLFQQIQIQIPDLVIMDIKIEGKNGKELCREMKSKPNCKDILVLLMADDLNKLKDYKDFNANAILEKPFSLKMFLSKINLLLIKKTGSLFNLSK